MVDVTNEEVAENEFGVLGKCSVCPGWWRKEEKGREGSYGLKGICFNVKRERQRVIDENIRDKNNVGREDM